MSDMHHEKTWIADGMTTIAVAAAKKTRLFVGLAVTTWPLLLTLPSYGVALAIAANGVCSGLYFSRFFASVTLRTPPALRARVSAAVNTLISATGPVGFVAAGVMLQHASLRATYALVAIAATLGAAMALAALRRAAY